MEPHKTYKVQLSYSRNACFSQCVQLNNMLIPTLVLHLYIITLTSDLIFSFMCMNFIWGSSNIFQVLKGTVAKLNVESLIQVLQIYKPVSSHCWKQSVRMKHSRGTYSAVNITALNFGDEKLPLGISTTVSFQKLSSSNHVYSVTSYYLKSYNE
jgi:hypothetical protein